MKLPFEFGPKLIFRLGLPGLMLGITTAPLVFAFAHTIKVDVDRLEVIAVNTVFWGWVISIADMPIYMLYEGRRFWPKPFREWGMESERRRLKAITFNTTDEMADKNPQLFLEESIKLLDFPIDEDGKPEVKLPTRVGNLITAYEMYTFAKYGLDAIFYWPRLWAVLDKDLREEIDNQQAVADSSIYISFAMLVSAIILVCYAIANGVFRSRLGSVPPPLGLLLLAIGCACTAYVIYRVSLFAHSRFGELFKAIFDQHRKKLVIDDIVEKVGSLVGDAEALKRPEAERYLMVSRFLRWHRVRPPGEEQNYTLEAWKNEQIKREKAVKASKAVVASK